MSTSTPDIPQVDLAQRDRAREAWTFGLIAVVLTAIQGCAGGMTLLAALPLGWIAMTRGRDILKKAPDGITEVYARTAQITGMVATIVSALFLAFFCGLFTLYAGVFAAVIGAAANNPAVAPP